jgi:ribonuclease VapC
VGRTLKALGVWVELIGEDDARIAAAMADAHPGMSLADRFCLAVGERMESPVYTADRVWAEVRTSAKVVLIR